MEGQPTGAIAPLAQVSEAERAGAVEERFREELQLRGLEGRMAHSQSHRSGRADLTHRNGRSGDPRAISNGCSRPRDVTRRLSGCRHDRGGADHHRCARHCLAGSVATCSIT